MTGSSKAHNRKIYWSFALLVLLWPFLIRLVFHSQDSNSSPENLPLLGAPQTIETLIEQGQLQEAEQKLKEEIAARGQTYKTFYLEAFILFKEKRFMESLEKLERSFSLEKHDPEVQKLAGLNWVVLNRLDNAEPFLKSAAQLAPNDYLAHYYLGRLYYTAQRFSEAESEFQKVLKLNPYFVKGHDNLGLTLEALGNEQPAIQSYLRAIELNEQQNLQNEWPYLNLAKFLLALNRYQESFTWAKKSTQMNPRSAEAFYTLGKVLDKLGKDVEALEALEASRQNDSNFAETHYLLSRIYLKQGRQEEARRESEIFQQLKKKVVKRLMDE
jgi:tetratricopeptide (TPR) repeat protein